MVWPIVRVSSSPLLGRLDPVVEHLFKCDSVLGVAAEESVCDIAEEWN